MPLNQWAKLSVFLSGARAATSYTIIGNCHRVGIDATAYLTELFKREPTKTNQTVHRLTPLAWATDQAALRQTLALSSVAGV